MNPESLQSQLQKAAADSAPAFSPLLHQRIMTSLRAHEARVTSATAPLRRLPLWPFAIAASLSIVATIAFHVLAPTAPPKPSLADLPSPSEIIGPVNTILNDAAKPASDSLNDAKFAYLDQDAKRLMFFIADQLPGPPASAEKNNPQ